MVLWFWGKVGGECGYGAGGAGEIIGRGKGGSVARVSYEPAQAVVEAESTEEVAHEMTSALRRETDLYEPMQKGLNGWLGHKNIQNTIIYSKFSVGTRDARARKMFSSNRVV